MKPHKAKTDKMTTDTMKPHTPTGTMSNGM
jgi:hypothetical protein